MQYNLFTDEDLKRSTPFTDRVVSLIGFFGSNFNTLKKRILDLGAKEVRTSVSRSVNYVLVGQDIPESQQELLNEIIFHGFCPRILHKAEIDDIFSGHYFGYETPKELTKNLSLSIQHYKDLMQPLTDGYNSLYTKELYISPETLANHIELPQLLGDLGIYANSYIDESTEVLLMPDSSIENLRVGKTDHIIKYIQDSYNALRTQYFTFNMITESEMLRWLKSFAI